MIEGLLALLLLALAAGWFVFRGPRRRENSDATSYGGEGGGDCGGGDGGGGCD